MPLSRLVGKYFDAWVGRATWHTGHAIDIEYFYKFVHAVSSYSKRPPGADEIRNLINERWQGNLDPELLARRANEYAQLYEHLYEFSKAPTRDPLIERTNIHAYYMAVRAAYGDGRDTEVQLDMRSTWGDNWQAKLGHY